MEEILGHPCSLFLGMTTPLNLAELNHSSPHDSVLLTQKLRWMLQIRQVSIERCDIINDNINGWLQTFLELRDVELSYPVFTPKPSTHRMHDPGSIVPHIQPKGFTDN
jgi:hypothetical protein